MRLRERHGEDERDGLWIPAIYGTLTDVNNKGKTPGQILDDSQNVKNDIAEAIPWEAYKTCSKIIFLVMGLFVGELVSTQPMAL